MTTALLLAATAAWAQNPSDPNYLDRELVRLHANAFHRQSPQEWRGRIEAIEAGLTEMSDLEIQVEFARLVASVGDAHTDFSPWYGTTGGLDSRRLPFQFAWFDGDLVIIAAAENQLDLLWHKVVRFGPTPIDEAERLVRSIVSYEVDSWFYRTSPSVFLMVDLLEALGVLAPGQEVELELESMEGEREVVVIEPLAPGTPLAVSTSRSGESRIPTFSKSFWSVLVEDVLYVRYRRCEWSWPLREFAKRIMDHLDESPSTRLVIDLRNNPGGTSLPFRWLVVPEIVARPDLNRPDRLFVFVNGGTFSSGSGIAAELRNETRATFVGEPTGGVPNGYGEVRRFRLPFSGLEVAYSTERFDRLQGHGEVGVPVDQLAPSSVEDFRARRDPALEWVLSR